MAAGRLDIVIEINATFALPFTWLTGGVSGTPVNLTGYDAKMQVRKDYDSPDTLLDLSVTSGHITLGGSLGTVSISAPPEETLVLPPGPAVYDLLLISGSGVTTRLLEGLVDIRKRVTE
jgi:hypothetical protein